MAISISALPLLDLAPVMIIPCHINNISRHSYFHRPPVLWNVLPIINLDSSFLQLKSKLKAFHWNRFLTNFDESNNCTLYYMCPCTRCYQLHPPTANF